MAPNPVDERRKRRRLVSECDDPVITEDDLDSKISTVCVLYTGGTIGMANKGPHKGKRVM
jgi:L-asparaginase/Glu-tRNA(Gln) amidotransferase subunit D